MTGVDIIGALLGSDQEFLTIVSADSLKAGMLPDGVQLPAGLLRLVSSVEPRPPLKRGETMRTVDRVSFTVRAQSYRDQRRVIKRARAVCAGRVGNIGGAASVSILMAGTGPDVNGPANTFEQTIDFRVSFDA